MFDFDLSIRMPESVWLLPASYTWITVGPWPHDAAQGEYMYDPFAYDVALLGIVFCQAFQVCPFDACRLYLTRAFLP